MKPEKKPRKPRKDKLTSINLSKMTCAQLVEWLLADRTANESQKCKRLRDFYRHNNRLELLKLCGPLKASHHYRHTMTARHLAAVPSIEMKIGAGRPDARDMPPFTAALKRIGAINGMVIHRWGSGAFMLAHPLKEQAERFALEKEA